MAEEYVREVRTVQPEGPYYIGGFSAGGLVAFEMARQLTAGGQQIGVLALLDTRMEAAIEAEPVSNRNPVSRWTRILRSNIRYAKNSELQAFITQKVKNLRMRSRVRLRPVEELNAEEAFLLAIEAYRPQTYQGNAILFRAREEYARYPDATLGWGPIIQGNLEIQEVSGDHDTILYEPHIGRLAHLLDESLRVAASSLRNSVQPSLSKLDSALQVEGVTVEDYQTMRD